MFRCSFCAFLILLLLFVLLLFFTLDKKIVIGLRLSPIKWTIKWNSVLVTQRPIRCLPKQPHLGSKQQQTKSSELSHLSKLFNLHSSWFVFIKISMKIRKFFGAMNESCLSNQCRIPLYIIYNLWSIFIIQGIAMLFDRSGGKLTESMADIIAISKSNNVRSELLLKEVRKIWDEWDLQESTGNSL